MKSNEGFVWRVIFGMLLVIASVTAVRLGFAGTPATVAAAAPAANEVSISNFKFQPAVLVVKAGTKVTWSNRDTTPHTVTSTDRRFASSAGLDTNDQYSVEFDKPGTYGYFCSLHPMMVGKIVVKPAD